MTAFVCCTATFDTALTALGITVFEGEFAIAGSASFSFANSGACAVGEASFFTSIFCEELQAISKAANAQAIVPVMTRLFGKAENGISFMMIPFLSIGRLWGSK